MDEYYSIINIGLATCAAFFAYFKFFREGTHKQRIQFDIDCLSLGNTENSQIIEVGCIAENKGNIEQRFDDIRVKIRGLDSTASLEEIEGHEPRLAFPIKLAQASLITEKMGYYFVRPKVIQRFPLVIRIPNDCDHIIVRATFKYKGTDDLHTSERAFLITG
ncbi:hypothetical protein P4C99_16370 [Pontiellaceae bacterium B1224]|nr:hypothetical protein [Pontiellaceae bacterium B1224]